jgi:hypothetical protein
MTKSCVLVIVLATLAGCGVESAGMAATAASIKQRELEEAKKTQARAQQRIDEATTIMQQRAQQPAGDSTR